MLPHAVYISFGWCVRWCVRAVLVVVCVPLGLCWWELELYTGDRQKVSPRMNDLLQWQ